MSASLIIKKMLEKEQIHFVVLEHPPAFTAMEIAEAQHVQGHRLIKSIVLKADDQWIMCVLPATHLIDFEKLKKMIPAKDIELASETQLAKLFPKFEVGAMPPFGQLIGVKVYLDQSLEENEFVVFNAGSHSDLLKIKFRDYMRLVKPKMGDFGQHV